MSVAVAICTDNGGRLGERSVEQSPGVDDAIDLTAIRSIAVVFFRLNALIDAASAMLHCSAVCSLRVVVAESPSASIRV